MFDILKNKHFIRKYCAIFLRKTQNRIYKSKICYVFKIIQFGYKISE